MLERSSLVSAPSSLREQDFHYAITDVHNPRVIRKPLDWLQKPSARPMDCPDAIANCNIPLRQMSVTWRVHLHVTPERGPLLTTQSLQTCEFRARPTKTYLT
jgi:hypothetical protein